MNRIKHMRNALTMVELVFVIVILGIVSSIGAELIANTYESYIIQRAQYRATAKTDLALNQIANRLRYAIPGTVGFRANTTGSFKLITEANSGNDKVLQWVAYDGDSFEAISSAADRKPGWSGFCDVNASTTATLSTPGSNLNLASTIMGHLGSSLATSNIYFPDGTTYTVNSGNGANISVNIPAGNVIFERYKLARSSYALSCENGTTTHPCGDLYLYYNFAPIAGQALGGSKNLLLRNVDNFRFKGSEGSIRIKICKSEQVGLNTSDAIHTCKEKVIF